MILRVYAVYDMKAQAYLAPFFLLRDGQAIRAFTDSVNDRNTMLNKHPRDYSLWFLGEFDDSTGQLSASVHVELALAAGVVIVAAEDEPSLFSFKKDAKHA